MVSRSLHYTSLRSSRNHGGIICGHALPLRTRRLQLLLSLTVIFFLGSSARLAHAACTMYCNSGDTLRTPTTCRDTISATGVCTGRFTRSSGSCVAPKCPGIVSTKYANIGQCCTGTREPVPSSNSCFDLGSWFYCGTSVNSADNWCYDDQPGASPACPSGSSQSGSNCVHDFPMDYTCPSGYTLSGTSCYTDYDASDISTQAQCTRAAPATDGCQWCSGISICLPTASVCPATCPDAAQSICTVTPTSTCQWCPTLTSIGVCQLGNLGCFGTCLAATSYYAVCDASVECKYCSTSGSIGVCQPISSGTCWETCLLASNDPVGSSVCAGSTSCQWCPSTTSIGVCQPRSGSCWATCTPASDDPLGSGVCTTSADCKWCPTLNYCTEQTRNCHTLCPTVAPDDPAICQVQSIQAQCQWCGAPGSVEYCVARTDEARLRCASSCSGLIWRQDVCDGALECHWCGVHNGAQGGRCKPLPGKSRGYVAWRREVECDTESESYSTTDDGTFSRTTVSTETASETSTISPTVTASTSSTTTASFSFSSSLSLSRSASTSISRSYSTTVSSATISGGTKSLTRTSSGSASSASISISYHLPPCNASHLETLAYVWPQLFNFTTNYSAVRQVGFPSILLTGDVRDPGLIYRVPQLLRREVLYHARPMYVTPVPYETPNVDGFVGRADTAPIELRWVSRTTLEVTMAPIGDYWLDTGERITIDVPFEEIELCNRTDPESLYVPPTLQLVAVDIVGPRVDTTATTGVEVVSAIAALASFITGDASSAGSIQTMVMLGMSPCSQPTSKQSMSSLRALGPLPIGIDGYAGVVVGNIVIAACVALLQFGVVRGLLVAKRASSALEACEIVRAPSMTIAAFFSFYQGTFYAAAQLMARPGMDDGERGGGAVAFVFVFAAPLVTVWFCRSRLPRMCIAYDFKQSRLYHQLYSGPIAYVMLPRSRIEPIQQRRMYSTLISSYRSPHPLVPVLPIAIPFLLTLLALWSPDGSNQCTMFFSLALSIHVVVCAAMIALRPLHLRYDLPLLVCGIVINGALLLLSILGISDPHFDMRDATFALVVAQVVVQIVKTLLRFWSNKLEDLLENVPTYTEWSIGYGHLIADIDKVLTLDAGGEVDDVEMLAIGLLDATGDDEVLDLHLEDEEHEAHDDVVTEDLQDQQEMPSPHALELLPVIGGCDAADHAVGGDASEGLCDLTHALETLVRLDEEMRLRDELRLSAEEPVVAVHYVISEEPAAPAHNREGLAEDKT